MNNLFIVNTPYHLLTSFILSQSFTPPTHPVKLIKIFQFNQSIKIVMK